MKALFGILMVLVSATAMADTPTCVNVGSRSEGWRIGGKLYWAQCRDEVIFCGSTSTTEGWYTATAIPGRRIAFANCSEDQSTKPTCVNIGSRSEGWSIGNELRWAQCAETHVMCGNIGSKSEGWYEADLEKDMIDLLVEMPCSN